MQSKAMRRAMRSARAVIHGGRILEFVQRPKSRQLLVAAAKTGAPPVAAISRGLSVLVGSKDAKLMPLKQFVGLCVRAVLEEEGFEVAEIGVRLSNDPVFRTGSTYQRAEVGNTDNLTLLARIVRSMTDNEARQALKLLRDRRR